jgi:hypothetical protein
MFNALDVPRQGLQFLFGYHKKSFPCDSASSKPSSVHTNKKTRKKNLKKLVTFMMDHLLIPQPT